MEDCIHPKEQKVTDNFQIDGFHGDNEMEEE